MSTSPTQPHLTREIKREIKPEVTLTHAIVGGIAAAFGIMTIMIVAGHWLAASTAVSNVLIQIGHWLGAAPAADSRVYWYMSRSAGIVAYLLLWGSVAGGIMMTNKLLNGLVKPAAMFEIHKSLSILALIVGMFHGFILLGDTYMNFSVLDLLIPFRSPYQPFAVGLGILGLYLTAILVASFYIKQHIGKRAWRLLHYTSFGVWIMTSLHGIMAGTDTQSILMKMMYAVAIVSVGYLLTYRIFVEKEPVPVRVRAR
jgi:predicted ferric reductase